MTVGTGKVYNTHCMKIAVRDVIGVKSYVADSNPRAMPSHSNPELTVQQPYTQPMLVFITLSV